MTLYLIGLGLGDEKDISVKGLEIIKSADIVILEHYTSIIGTSKEKLEQFYSKEIILGSRDLVEKEAEEKILKPAIEKNVVFLVVGDVFTATTHTDLMLRAKEFNIETEVVFNAGIINAVGIVGLELYKYGKVTSIPFEEPGFRPRTPYEVIKMNKANGLHTLCLLDIKVSEPSKEELRTGVVKQVPKPRFMTIKQAIEYLLSLEDELKENIISENDLMIGVARIGHENCQIIADSAKNLLAKDFGSPLHSLIIPGKLQIVEEEALQLWR